MKKSDKISLIKQELYTAKEIARALGVSTNTIYKYLDEGKIKALRFSKRGRFRIPESEVMRLFDAKGQSNQMPNDTVHKKGATTKLIEIFREIICLSLMIY